ncbi:MAG: patatin-like phospholipase family protein [Solirubrobacteraceae bacterium]
MRWEGGLGRFGRAACRLVRAAASKGKRRRASAGGAGEAANGAASDDKGLQVVSATDRYEASKWTGKTFRRALLCGERPPPIPSWTGVLEEPEAGKIGIACSGGGIRSAAFGLGALQVLQDENVLSQARYLAGVSGGSYVAAAFCMVRKTWEGEEAPQEPDKKWHARSLLARWQTPDGETALEGWRRLVPRRRPLGPEPEGATAGWDDSNPHEIARHPPFFLGSPEEQYLRNRSSYLAPGAFGKIELGYRLLLGMTLNLLFIGAGLAAAACPLALLYGWLYPSLIAHLVHGGLCMRVPPKPVGGEKYRNALCELLPLNLPTELWMALAALAGVALFLGGASILCYRWRAFVTMVLEVWSLRLLLVAFIGGFMLIGLPVLLSLFRAWGTAMPNKVTHLADGLNLPEHHPYRPKATGGTSFGTAAVAGAGGVATLGGAVLLQLRADWTAARKVLAEAGTAQKWYAKLAPAVRRILAYLIAGLAGPVLALALVVEVMSLVLNTEADWVRWVIAGGALGGFLIAYTFADMTTWSLHSFYRRRLCSAFALKRVARERKPGNPVETESRIEPRNPVAPANPRDGGDANTAEERWDPPIADVESGKAVERNYRRAVTISRTGIPPDADGQQAWPTLLVCAAANISDNAATPPGRGVTSFTFSASTTGGPLVGAVPTSELEQMCDKARLRYFTLPAAVAMSGAALSPSMGKMTKGPLRLLMALANVRLGVWVPNPRRMKNPRRGKRGANLGFATPRASYLLRELLGMNPLNAPYLYVTDGGHYENLGLVELLRRGCTEIYCFDASNDNFDAIGDAVALARSELGVEVDVKCKDMEPDAKTGRASKDCVSAEIKYPGKNAPAATLYYARLVMTDEVPADVIAYHRADPHFPHDPTTDQLYTDQRFEAYRALGANTARSALAQRDTSQAEGCCRRLPARG